MRHQHQFTAAPINWSDRVVLARSNAILAPFHIEALRDEALELAAKRYCDYLINEAVADAAQAWLDCPCDDCLDEIDAILNPAEVVLPSQYVERLAPAVYGGWR